MYSINDFIHLDSHSSVGKECACNAGDPGFTLGLGRSAGEGIGYPLQYSQASLVAQLVNNLPTMREIRVQSLGWERSPEEGKGYPLQYSGLENSMDYIVHGVAKSRTRLSNFHSLTSCCLPAILKLFISEVPQSCPTLWTPMDCSLPGSSFHGILQARVLEWGAISFSRGSSWPRDQTLVSSIPGRHFNLWATREVQKQFIGLHFSLVRCPSLGLQWKVADICKWPVHNSLQYSQSPVTNIEFTWIQFLVKGLQTLNGDWGNIL